MVLMAGAQDALPEELGKAFGLGWLLFGGFSFLIVIGLLAWLSFSILARYR